MLDGMRMAAQGMLAQSARQDVITNNLANVSSAGFRKESLMISSFTEILNREVGMEGMTQAGGELTQAGGMSAAGGLNYQTVTHTNQGSLKETGNPFDLALDDNGQGFFTIQTQEGIKFTRAGNFKLSTSGYLVTADGSFVLGHRGPIKLNGTDFKVDEQGYVMVDGRPIDRLLITTFTDPREMQKAGDNQFVAGQAQVRATTDSRLKQGYLEMANVNQVQEMVDLMMVMRSYEANQKVLQSHDQRLQKAANELGRVR